VDYYDYYGGWREKTFSCLCGWDEAGGEAEAGEMFDELGERCCTKCGERVFMLNWPTATQVEVAAFAGNEEATRQLVDVGQRQTRMARAAREDLISVDQLPDVDAEDIRASLDVESESEHNPEMCLFLNGTIVHREPAWYEGIEPLVRMLPILQEKYGERLHSISIGQGASLYLLGSALQLAHLPSRVGRPKRAQWRKPLSQAALGFDWST